MTGVLKRSRTAARCGVQWCRGFSCAAGVGERDGEEYGRQLQRAISPLSAVPYERQLQLKHVKCATLLQQLGARLAEMGCEVGQHETLDRIVKQGGLYCPVDQTRPSPITDNYRNKTDYSVGVGADGNTKTVGYFVGEWRKKTVVCVPPTFSNMCKAEHKRVAEAYQAFIRNSPLQPMSNFQDGGHWRGIMVRSNHDGHMMAVVTLHPQQLSRDDIQEVKDSLRDYFVAGEGKYCNLKSLYFQESTKTRTSHEESRFELLHGAPHIREKISDLQFRISPSSFFQVNTAAAEVLYSTVGELCRTERNRQLDLPVWSGRTCATQGYFWHGGRRRQRRGRGCESRPCRPAFESCQSAPQLRRREETRLCLVQAGGRGIR